jgi:hypothetical protein
VSHMLCQARQEVDDAEPRCRLMSTKVKTANRPHPGVNRPSTFQVVKCSSNRQRSLLICAPVDVPGVPRNAGNWCQSVTGFVVGEDRLHEQVQRLASKRQSSIRTLIASRSFIAR